MGNQRTVQRIHNITNELLRGMERKDCMNTYQNRDLIVQFDMVRRKLQESGKDLSRIPIVMDHDAKPSYITQRIISDLERSAE